MWAFEELYRLGSSPHTRGAHGRSDVEGRSRRIIPAYAGSTNRHPGRTGDSPDHPRIRGEHTPMARRSSTWLGSSPHTRGAPSRTRQDHRRSRIIPAYAGSTFSDPFVSAPGPDHPRIRGEHYSRTFCVLRIRGSSPHTRGARVVCHEMLLGPGIIPAYAGSTTACLCRSISFWDHPRIRGEHSRAWRLLGSGRGSSPHTRGALSAWELFSLAVRIIPAYAGSTGSNHTNPCRRPDHPRIRGEHVSLGGLSPLLYGSSPHTRGAPAWPAGSWRRRRIIPAYAGSTDSSVVSHFSFPDHPRIRGEHYLGVQPAA